jgi:hypothetical protein
MKRLHPGEDAGRTQAETERRWEALYGAAELESAQSSRRRTPPRRRKFWIGASAAAVVTTCAGLAFSQAAAWPITLISFSPNTPALATEMNTNLQRLKAATEQLKTWVDTKVGAADNANVTARGMILQDSASADYDVWLQGGLANTTGGDTRNLALLGLTQGRGDKLIVNYGGEYASGVEVQGSLLQTTGRLGIGAGLAVTGDTTLTGNLNVTGTVTSRDRYLVEAHFDNDFPGANVTNTSVTVDQTRLTELCSDDDGCSITLIMDDFLRNGEDASIGPVHFAYSSSTGRFRTAEISGNSEVARTIGVDGNNVVEHALRAWNCYLTDTAYTQNQASPLTDNTRQMFLMNYNSNTAYQPICRLVIDD